MQQTFWSFLTHSDCITQIPVLMPLINTFVFEEEEREHHGPQRSKGKLRHWVKPRDQEIGHESDGRVPWNEGH